MPKVLYARPPGDPDEARQVRKLANSRHAPGDWILRARMIVRSWSGLCAPRRSPPSWDAILKRCANVSTDSTPRG
ncbi:MAG TPA: hypothetical protein VK902_11910 [Rubrobacter sp.]|jgi:hypothetical protein|nr:hypothetical protein [Rubrobacter sp.]